MEEEEILNDYDEFFQANVCILQRRGQITFGEAVSPAEHGSCCLVAKDASVTAAVISAEEFYTIF